MPQSLSVAKYMNLKDASLRCSRSPIYRYFTGLSEPVFQIEAYPNLTLERGGRAMIDCYLFVMVCHDVRVHAMSCLHFMTMHFTPCHFIFNCAQR